MGYKKPKQFKDIALKRIHILFEQAELRFNEDSALSDRYVELARKISMKYKVKMPHELKRKYCKHCYSYLVPGNNCRVRLNEGKVVVLCHNCRELTRYPYET